MLVVEELVVMVVQRLVIVEVLKGLWLVVVEIVVLSVMLNVVEGRVVMAV